MKINGARLWSTLTDYATIGQAARGGVSRLALSDADKAARDRFGADLAAVGARLIIDDVGNMYGWVDGADPTLDPVVIGSHLDSVQEGGRFDGALGVIAGLEALRTLSDAGLSRRRPLVLVNWTNEEGARFEPAMMASGVVAGRFDKAWIDGRTDRDGKTFGAELARIGYCGDRANRLARAHAYFELHIEQGPQLEAAGREVGVVDGIMGISWYDLAITGQADHAGPTPLGMRRDPLLAAAAIITAAREIAETIGGGAVSTVGRIAAHPNIINVIPGRVQLSVDLRHPTRAGLEAMHDQLAALVDQVATAHRVGAQLDRFWVSEPTAFDGDLLASLDQACAELGLSATRITSAAGHDAKYMADRFPTAMIFTPTKDGKSHCEEEWAEPAWVENGANVLLRAVLAASA